MALEPLPADTPLPNGIPSQTPCERCGIAEWRHPLSFCQEFRAS